MSSFESPPDLFRKQFIALTRLVGQSIVSYLDASCWKADISQWVKGETGFLTVLLSFLSQFSIETCVPVLTTAVGSFDRERCE